MLGLGACASHIRIVRGQENPSARNHRTQCPGSNSAHRRSSRRFAHHFGQPSLGASLARSRRHHRCRRRRRAPGCGLQGGAAAGLVDDDARHAAGDPDRLQQIVWNLLSNAVKFTPKGGTVTVRLSRSDSQAEIRVTDSGAGIEARFPSAHFRAFQAGQRHDHTIPRRARSGARDRQAPRRAARGNRQCRERRRKPRIVVPGQVAARSCCVADSRAEHDSVVASRCALTSGAPRTRRR